MVVSVLGSSDLPVLSLGFLGVVLPSTQVREILVSQANGVVMPHVSVIMSMPVPIDVFSSLVDALAVINFSVKDQITERDDSSVNVLAVVYNAVMLFEVVFMVVAHDS